MLHRILLIEKEIIYVFTVFLILFNLVSLYFIVDLLSYDEVIGYLTNGEIKSSNPRNLAFLFFGATILNLLFVLVALLAKLLSPNSVKKYEVK
jgi:1,4-dihydroxy-2-naphthoate octaprenyltransferase